MAGSLILCVWLVGLSARDITGEVFCDKCTDTVCMVLEA